MQLEGCRNRWGTGYRRTSKKMEIPGREWCIKRTMYNVYFSCFTPPKINIEPENDGLEDVSPFPGVYCQGPC